MIRQPKLNDDELRDYLLLTRISSRGYDHTPLRKFREAELIFDESLRRLKIHEIARQMFDGESVLNLSAKWDKWTAAMSLYDPDNPFTSVAIKEATQVFDMGDADEKIIAYLSGGNVWVAIREGVAAGEFITVLIKSLLWPDIATLLIDDMHYWMGPKATVNRVDANAVLLDFIRERYPHLHSMGARSVPVKKMVDVLKKTQTALYDITRDWLTFNTNWRPASDGSVMNVQFRFDKVDWEDGIPTELKSLWYQHGTTIWTIKPDPNMPARSAFCQFFNGFNDRIEKWIKPDNFTIRRFPEIFGKPPKRNP